MLARTPVPTVECARENCGLTRNRPCSGTCYLTTGAFYAEAQREAQRAAERAEMARQNIQEYQHGTR